MSEEKPTFKVTDRRLFNPDGTPRDIEREAAATGAEAAETQAATPSSSASPAETAGREPSPPLQQQQSSQPGAASETRPAASSASSVAGEAEDPTAFANLVMFIASPAAAA